MCEDPPTVANADMFGGGFVFEAHVHYTCREGYKMQGAADLACGEQGKWIGEVPVCTGKFQLYPNQYFSTEFSQSSVSSKCMWFSSKFSRINAENK